MKRVLAVALFLGLGAGACGPDAGPNRPPRGDWRHQAAVCTSDDQCGGGACVMADGATRGTCSAPPGDPSLPPGHPSRRPHDPNAPNAPNAPGEEPSVKPQPGDIQL